MIGANCRLDSPLLTNENTDDVISPGRLFLTRSLLTVYFSLWFKKCSYGIDSSKLFLSVKYLFSASNSLVFIRSVLTSYWSWMFCYLKAFNYFYWWSFIYLKTLIRPSVCYVDGVTLTFRLIWRFYNDLPDCTLLLFSLSSDWSFSMYPADYFFSWVTSPTNSWTFFSRISMIEFFWRIIYLSALVSRSSSASSYIFICLLRRSISF